jgi:hypothetical protein
MLYPQIVVKEADGQLAGQLRPLATAERWALRELRQSEPLFRTLATGGPTVFVLKFGDDPEAGLALLERVAWHLPDVAIVAVGDIETDPALAGLAWDVGAAHVLFPPQNRDLLPDIAAGLMRRAVRNTLPVAVSAEPPP